MKRIFCFTLVIAILCCLVSCERDKNISVVVREPGSGTREAFDRVVGNGEHFLEERDSQGKKIYNISKTAIQQTKNGTVIWTVVSDKHAVGYISLGSVDSSVKVLKIDGVLPSEDSVLSGEYKIQRPFVIMTKRDQRLTALASDFMSYLKSEASIEHSRAAGCVFLSDPSKRANEGESPIKTEVFEKQENLPEGEKILIRGSTSVERFINSAAKGYADIYDVRAEDIFDIQLEGSSVGRRAVERDNTGNLIGLSSASVTQDNIDSFNVCVDAVAVIVNKENTAVSDLSIDELYGIFSGEISKFKDIGGGENGNGKI